MLNHNVHYQKINLSKELDQVVKYCWIMKSEEAIQSDYDLLIPDGYPEIIFVLKGTYEKKGITENEELSIIEKSCVIGIQSQSVLARRKNYCHLVGLKLYPWGAYRLFKNQLNLIANKNVSITEFGLEWLNVLNDELQSINTSSEIVEFISEKLRYQIKQQHQDNTWKTAEAYLKTILSKDGQISVQELAQQHCLSIRHFQRKFKQYYGLSPKKMINIIRFKKLYKSSVLQKKMPEAFLEFGYYDQMHFIKDFQKQLGITPSKSTEKMFLKRNDMAKRNA